MSEAPLHIRVDHVDESSGADVAQPEAPFYEKIARENVSVVLNG